MSSDFWLQIGQSYLCYTVFDELFFARCQFKQDQKSIDFGWKTVLLKLKLDLFS